MRSQQLNPSRLHWTKRSKRSETKRCDGEANSRARRRHCLAHAQMHSAAIRFDAMRCRAGDSCCHATLNYSGPPEGRQGDGTSSSTQHGQTIPVATCRDKRIFLRLIDVPRVTGGSRNWSACGESWGGREHLLGRPGTEILEPTRLGRDSRRTPLRCAPAEPFSQRSVAADPSCRNGGWIEGLSRSSSRSGETVGFE